MKKNYIFLVCCIVLLTMSSCTDENVGTSLEEEMTLRVEQSEIQIVEAEEPYIKEQQESDNEEEIHLREECEIETDIYAIYPSFIQESNADRINEYVHYNKVLQISFPQLYYSNEFTEYDEDIEQSINQMLFELSMGNNINILSGRDNREIQEYSVDYRLTDVGDTRFSINYQGKCYTVWKAQEFCYGITIDVLTGEALEITDFITLDEELLEQIKSGEIKYTSEPEYDEEIVLMEAEWLLNDYNAGLLNLKNCFFVEEDKLYLILKVHQSNSNYILLEINWNNR